MKFAGMFNLVLGQLMIIGSGLLLTRDIKLTQGIFGICLGLSAALSGLALLLGHLSKKLDQKMSDRRSDQIV